MQSFSKKFKVLLIILVFPFSMALAEEDDDPINPPSDPGIPVDGGLGLLLAAGAAYGGKKIYDLRKKKESKPAEG